MNLTSAPVKGFVASYWALWADRDFNGPRTNLQNAAAALVPRFGARNQVQVTPPGGAYGGLGSRLLRLLQSGHHDVELNADELEHLAAWIDGNAVCYGSYRPEDQARERRGEELPFPAIQ